VLQMVVLKLLNWVTRVKKALPLFFSPFLVQILGPSSSFSFSPLNWSCRWQGNLLLLSLSCGASLLVGPKSSQETERKRTKQKKGVHSILFPYRNTGESSLQIESRPRKHLFSVLGYSIFTDTQEELPFFQLHEPATK